MFEIQ